MPAQKGETLLVEMLIMQEPEHICLDQECQQVILLGEEVVRSPTQPDYFYHYRCFEKMAGDKLTIIVL